MKTYTREVYTFRTLKMSVELEGNPDYEPTPDELDDIVQAVDKDGFVRSWSVTLGCGRTFKVAMSHKPRTVWFDPEQFELSDRWESCDPIEQDDVE